MVKGRQWLEGRTQKSRGVYAPTAYVAGLAVNFDAELLKQGCVPSRGIKTCAVSHSFYLHHKLEEP